MATTPTNACKLYGCHENPTHGHCNRCSAPMFVKVSLDEIKSRADETDTFLRNKVRHALVDYRNFLRDMVDEGEGEHSVSLTQIESAMRVLWMENS